MKILPLFLATGLLILAGCSKASAPAEAKHSPAAHAHQAPNGGTLVELGHHQFNLELLHDPVAGTLTVHVLNDHATGIVRLDALELPVVLRLDGAERRLILRPVEDRLSSETAGDSSVFSAQADWLRPASGLEGFFPAITIRGLRFEQVRFGLPGPTPPR
jgi:hypothetical protein